MPEDPRSLIAPIDASRPRAQQGLAVTCVPDGRRLTVRSVAASPGWPLPVPAEGEDLLEFLRARITDPSLVDTLASAAAQGNPGMVSLYFTGSADGHRLRWLPTPDGEISCHIAPPAPAFRVTGPPEPDAGTGIPDQMVWGGRIVGGRVILEFVTGGFPSILRSRWDPLRLMDEWMAAIHPEDREQALARFGEVRADSPPRSSEYRVVRPDGTLRWVRSTVAPFAGVYPDLGVWAIITDITEERATRQELEHLLEMVQDLVLEIGWDASGAWFVRSLSPSAAGLLGVGRGAPAEVGAEFERRLHADDLPLLDGALRRLRAGASSERVALRLTTAAGNVVRLEGALVTARDAGAGPRVLGMLSDVTERRAAEARLRRIAEVIEPVLCEAEILPDGRWSFPYMSPSAALLIGAPLPADPVEAAAAFLGGIHVDDVPQVAAMAERVLREGGSAAIDYRHVRADGEIRRVRSTMARFIGDDGRPRIAGVKTDLTDQWEAQESAQRVLASVGAIALELEIRPDGRWAVEQASSELERLIGRPLPAEPVAAGGVLFRSIHPDDRPRIAIMREQLRTANSVTDEHRIVQPGGEVRWVRVTVAWATPVLGGGGGGGGSRARGRRPRDAT